MHSIERLSRHQDRCMTGKNDSAIKTINNALYMPRHRALWKLSFLLWVKRMYLSSRPRSRERQISAAHLARSVKGRSRCRTGRHRKRVGIRSRPFRLSRVGSALDVRRHLSVDVTHDPTSENPRKAGKSLFREFLLTFLVLRPMQSLRPPLNARPCRVFRAA